MDLILPYHRARNQPADHRMNMFVGTEGGPVKLKVVSKPLLLVKLRHNLLHTVSELLSFQILPRNPSIHVGCHCMAAF